MKTTNCKKTHLLDELVTLNETIKGATERADEIKAYFKNTYGPGVIESDKVICFIEKKVRESVDRDALEKKLGAEKLKAYLKIAEFLQVIARRKAVNK